MHKKKQKKFEKVRKVGKIKKFLQVRKNEIFLSKNKLSKNKLKLILK